MKLPATFRWPRLTNWPLALEISLVLMIKIAILFAIWLAFFSNPQAKKMRVPMPQVEQHLLSITSKAESADGITPFPKAKSTNLTPLTLQDQHGSN